MLIFCLSHNYATMNILLLTSFFIIVYLRKKFQTATQLPWWNKKLLGIMFACIALQVIEITVPVARPLTILCSHLIILGIIGIIYLEEKFDTARPTVFAVLPLILVSFLGSLLKLINKQIFLKTVMRAINYDEKNSRCAHEK